MPHVAKLRYITSCYSLNVRRIQSRADHRGDSPYRRSAGTRHYEFRDHTIRIHFPKPHSDSPHQTLSSQKLGFWAGRRRVSTKMQKPRQSSLFLSSSFKVFIDSLYRVSTQIATLQLHIVDAPR